MFIVKNENTRREWHRSGVFTVNFEHNANFFLSVAVVDFEQVNVSWL